MTSSIFRSLILLVLTWSATTAVWAVQYEVTITNLTKGEPFSPTAVILHKPGMDPLFILGEPSSEGIWSIAEDGDTAPLVATLSGNPFVDDIQVTEGPFLPGESVSVILNSGPGHPRRQLSLAGMLGISNDAFYALNGQELPFPFELRLSPGSGVFIAIAYDAGSEVNSESCETVPGPPCGSVKVRDTEGAEGYVYVHSGIHGHGDLDAAALDWNNPVAKITVRVLR